ncbi:MAG: lysylphosphatidylglycerol synthase transmembrane domain-containing protein, partial [Candidatus Omnitrophica bacterium]|nr:lysylphosphatidylglycerol synthase transmembrane domain-containing protein [Candidatus Omnitrophota bacterium]
MKINQGLKNILIYFLKIAITVGLLVFLYTKTEIKFHDVVLAIKKANPVYFSIAVFLFAFNYFLGMFRWNILLKAAGVIVPFSRVVVSYLMGLAVNLFIPSTIGGDLARTVDLSVYSSNSKSKLLATVMLDSISGYIAVVTVAFISLFLGYKFVDKPVLISFAIIAGILLAIILVLFNRRIAKLMQAIFSRVGSVKNALVNFDESINSFLREARLKALLFTLVAALLIQVISVFIGYFIAESLGFHIDLIYFFVIIPIVNAISMIPLTMLGLGSRDLSSVYFFGRVGYPATYAETMSLIV